jgi:hypothetical protein
MDERHTYGKPLDPSTPIADVLANTFGDFAEQLTRSRYDHFHKMSQTVAKLECHNHHTKASTLAKEYVHHKQLDDGGFIAKNPLELFKMRKFANVGPRTNTNLSNKILLPPLPNKTPK